MRVAIEEILERQLPEAYTPEVYQQKCEAVYQHVYESYLERAGVSIRYRWRGEEAVPRAQVINENIWKPRGNLYHRRSPGDEVAGL